MRKKSYIILLVIIFSLITSCDLLSPSKTEGVVTFNSNGGSQVTSSFETEYVIKPEDPTYEGHVFIGWYSDEGLLNQWDFNNDKIQSDMTLYAKWSPLGYTISYNSNGATSGTAPQNQTKLYNLNLTLSDNSGMLAKTDYVFLGWNTSIDGTGTNYGINTVYSINESKTLYANWALSSYTVSYNKNGATSGSVPSNQTKFYDIPLTLSDNSKELKKTGFTFGGWNTKGDGSGDSYIENDNYSNNQSIILYARWLNKYSINYDGNSEDSGDTPESDTKVEGKDLTLSTNSGNLVKNGYVFDGWNTAANGLGTSYTASGTYTLDIATTLYANWKLSYDKLLASNGKMDDKFGSSLDISGDNIIVGVSNESVDSVYIYNKSNGTWNQKAILTATGWTAGQKDNFGQSVSISGTNALIGAPHDNVNAINSGSAYIFYLSGENWIQEQQLSAGIDGSNYDIFGSSVCISSNTAVIGAPGYDEAKGCVYVFNKESGNWILKQKLTPPDLSNQDSFGSSVSIYGNTIVAGAPLDDNENGENAGSIYIFTYVDSSWTYTTKFLAYDGSYDDSFGSSLSIHDDTIVVGAPYNELETGSVYVFKKDFDGSWNTHPTKLKADDSSQYDFFGTSVSITKDNIIIGSYGNDDNGDSSGSAYLFTKSDTGTWSQSHKLLAHDGSDNDKFGLSVSIDNNTFVVGSYCDDDKGTNSGSAYVRELP